MTERELGQIVELIGPPDRETEAHARAYVDSLAKPPGSLGRLEDIAVRLAGIRGSLHPKIEKTRIIVLCADNGVTAEGVSSAPVSVTMAQAVNMTRGLTGMAAIAGAFGDETAIVDVGIATPYRCDAVINEKILPGTGNIAVEPAMTRAEAIRAIGVGIGQAKKAAEEGADALGVGEMGIGNTTTSTAVLAVLTGRDPEELTGRGGGLTAEAFVHKKEIVAKAVRLHFPEETERGAAADPVDVLAKVGGLDLAAMCGVYLGAARERIPVVMDGFISVVAALAAVRIAPAAFEYIFPSHLSFEPGTRTALEAIGIRPFFDLGMRLGEGSGCPLGFRVLEAACAMMERMATFEKAAISDDYLEEIRKGDSFSV